MHKTRLACFYVQLGCPRKAGLKQQLIRSLGKLRVRMNQWHRSSIQLLHLIITRQVNLFPYQHKTQSHSTFIIYTAETAETIVWEESSLVKGDREHLCKCSAGHVLVVREFVPLTTFVTTKSFIHHCRTVYC